MEYVFGTVRRSGVMVENLRTVGEEHTDFTGKIQLETEYPDNIITDTCYIVEKYKTDVDAEGRCYDWYVVSNHNRYIDKFTPGIGQYEQEITDLEIENIEQEMALTDAEIAIMELQEIVGGDE